MDVMLKVDDQILFNTALKSTKIIWKQFDVPSSPIASDKSWEGSNADGLKVTLLAQEIACRHDGCRKEIRKSVYIWHHGKNRHKFETMNAKAMEDGVWFLREDWSVPPSNNQRLPVGEAWLSSVSTNIRQVL